jgi:nicotinate-nucleotide adenylyltransferase
MARLRPAAHFGSIRVSTPLAMPRQRIGIMGGSFNPPHEGHRIVAETAMKRLALDQLWWVVTPGNPLKSHGGLPPQAERIKACQKFATHPRMHVTGFEAALGTPYTAATLAFLQQRFPMTHFVWIMGADNLAHFDHWQNWRDIARRMPIVVVDRPGWRLKALSSKAGHAMLSPTQHPPLTFLSTRLSPLSSTALRQQSSQKKRS